MQTNEEMGENLSPEELDKKKDEMLKFYTDSMPYLNAQLEYESKLADIDEVRFKRFQISMQSAMMMQDENSENMSKEEAPAEPKRQPKKKKPLRTQ